MNVILNKPQATRIAFDENSFSVFLADGRILSVPLAFFPRLLQADKRQREHYEFSGDGTGIHSADAVFSRTQPESGPGGWIRQDYLRQ